MGSKDHPFEGRTCGNYVLRRVLDQGGVGVVFEAHHRFLDERAAIEILHEDVAREEGDLVRRFFQEAKATRAIEHPSIVKLLDFGQDEKDLLLYLVMELLEGESVLKALERGAMPEREAARIGAAVADGLQAAHMRGIIHRDLKPGNIFLCRDGQVKLLDFGLAKVQAATSQSVSGQFLGTPQYVAPEQIRDARRVSPKSDVYAFGGVLFRMVTGRPPFVAATTMKLIEAHLKETPPAPSRLAKVSPEMDALVLQCLAKEPADRPLMVEIRKRLQAMATAPSTVEVDAPEEAATLVDMPAPGFDVLAAIASEMPPPRPEPSAAMPLTAHDAPPSSREVSPSMGAGELMPTARAPAGTARVAPLPGPAARGSNGRRVALLAGAVALAALGGGLGVLWTRFRAPQPVAGAALAPGAATVEITSEPAGAKVVVSEEVRGVTPLTIALPLPTEITLAQPGFQTARQTVTRAGPVRVQLVPVGK